jgi:hypothetical protein
VAPVRENTSATRLVPMPPSRSAGTTIRVPMIQLIRPFPEDLDGADHLGPPDRDECRHSRGGQRGGNYGPVFPRIPRLGPTHRGDRGRVFGPDLLDAELLDDHRVRFPCPWSARAR